MRYKLMAQKFYSNNDGEMYYTLSVHIEEMRENEETERELIEEIYDIGGDHMWCREYDGFIERRNRNGYIMIVADNECGKSCENYAPRNGRSGICKHLGYCIEDTGRKLRLTLIDNKPKLEEITNA